MEHLDVVKWTWAYSKILESIHFAEFLERVEDWSAFVNVLGLGVHVNAHGRSDATSHAGATSFNC